MHVIQLDLDLGHLKAGLMPSAPFHVPLGGLWCGSSHCLAGGHADVMEGALDLRFGGFCAT